MSIRNWPAGIIRPVAVAPAGPLANGAAPGVWTLDQQAFWQKQGLWPVAGNFLYIEDVFSTYLYTGTGSAQTITNGIDLSGNGGLVWMKGRSGATDHALYDTARGATFDLVSNTTAAQTTQATGLTSFGSTGFTIGALAKINTSSATYVSWAFREQPKFFDVVTYTGNGVSGRTISHNLGSAPGCIIVKCTSTAGEYWAVYHTSTGPTKYLWLQDTIPASVASTYWNDTAPTSSVFSVGNDGAVNGNGKTYVAYLFAHDAGGFGASGADNVISCGSFTNTGSALSVNLGYEPQWLLFKLISGGGGDWNLVDNMRGFQVDRNASTVGLYPNLSSAESALGLVGPTSTGFTFDNGGSGQTYIYIAIRRGPMRTPTTGTSVFGLSARTGTGANSTVTGGQTDDAILVKNRGSAVASLFSSRLTGTGYLVTSSTAAEVAAGTTILQANPWDVMDGVKVGTASTITNASANTFINYLFRRAPGFFDVVCYTGTGVTPFSVAHNLAKTPEMAIIKRRSSPTTTEDWQVGHTGIANGYNAYLYATTSPTSIGSYFNINQSTASTFLVVNSGVDNKTNASGVTYVAYLFATVAGVSKVGSYTGTGTTKQIDCGFTAGARFVLIKRTDSTGDWYVWDSARGIVAGNDPYLLLNSTAAEVTSTDYVDTYSAGFEISSTAPAAINANGGSFIFLAIA